MKIDVYTALPLELVTDEKLPFPKSVFFIMSNECCERFSFYGMRTILILYLTNILLYSEADATITYHTFTVLVYFFPLFGAILSDSYLGKFNTILYVSMIYAAGSILIALSATDPLHIPKEPFSLLGLFLIALGSGGIKPCVSSFGGDQFVLPQQTKQLAAFFSLFYFSVNAGSFVSSFLTPLLRNNVHCFGNDSCFPVAFAVPGALMILSIIIFGAGKPFYKIKKPSGNVTLEVAKCITHAVGKKIKSSEKKEHWLDYSVDKYGQKLVNDVKATLKVLVLYIPLPIFSALYDQQGSGWTFQAVRMNGDIGFYTILPDQMQVINPILILGFIPLFTYGVYPLFAKCNLLTTPLQKMIVGGFLAALAFGVSAIVSLFLESSYPVLPSSGNIQLRFYNPSECSYNVHSAKLNITEDLPSHAYLAKIDIPFKNKNTIDISFNSINGLCASDINKQIKLEEQSAYGLYITKNNGIEYFEDEVAKSEDGYPRVRTLTYKDTDIYYEKDDESFYVPAGNNSLFSAPSPGKYSIKIGGEDQKDTVEFKLGGTYTVMIFDRATSPKFETFTVTNPNSVHMLWLLIQYFIITVAEILFSITGLEFSYSQAPVEMKSVLTACFLLTTALGNLIIVLIESAKLFDKQSSDFFLYTGLMVADMLLFAFMASKYTYYVPEDSIVDENEDEALEKPDKKLSNSEHLENSL